MSDAMKVTRQEEILYGPSAAVVRRLGQVATTVELAREDVRTRLISSREADEVTHGMRDEQGRSAHTAWLDRQLEQLWELEKSAREVYTSVAGQAMSNEKVRRAAIDSMPAPLDFTAEGVKEALQELRDGGHHAEYQIVVAPDLEQQGMLLFTPGTEHSIEGLAGHASWKVDEEMAPGKWEVRPAYIR